MSSDYDLRKNATDPDVSYYANGSDVCMNFGGDGLYLFSIKSNRKNTFAQQIVDILNAIKKECDHFDGRHGHRVCGECLEEVEIPPAPSSSEDKL